VSATYKQGILAAIREIIKSRACVFEANTGPIVVASGRRKVIMACNLSVASRVTGTAREKKETQKPIFCTPEFASTTSTPGGFVAVRMPAASASPLTVRPEK